MNKLLYFFMLYFIYSILGWIVESFYCTYYKKKLILNRGFLIGPYCPIYGTAAVIMTLFLTEYKDDLFILFCMSVVYTSIVEYLTSYVMEKVFKARWWDYSNQVGNLNGRICLKNSLLFGVCGVILIKAINPIFDNLYDKVPLNIFNIISIICMGIILIDFIISVIIVSKLKLKINRINRDSTEEIDKQVKEVLHKSNYFSRRIFKAFPKITFTNDKSGIVIKSIKARFDELDKNLNSKKNEIKKIKNNIKEIRNNSKDMDLLKKEKEKLKKVRKR